MRIAIIGAGTGGYVAAIRAAQLGAKVTLIEGAAVGGLCLNWGCIPSKSLLACAELAQKIRKAGEFGITITGAVTYDLARMVERKNKIVAGLVKGVRTLLKTWNVELIEGRGALVNATTVRVVKQDGTEVTLQADAIIVGTGTTAPALPNLALDGTHIISSREALDLTAIPDSLLIVGGGVEGCEFASLFSVLGTKVTLVEMLPRILPTEDEEVSALLTAELKKLGVTILANTRVEIAAIGSDGVTTILADGNAVASAKVLVSIGRRFNTAGLGLEEAGVQLGRRGEILVNERMETNVPGVYAIGDVVGKAMLAHVASAQGKVAVRNILGRPATMSYDVIPAGIFTFPEIGRVGLTEQEARQHGQGMEIKVGKFRPIGLGKAHASGETTGLMKIITEAKTGRIVGVHLVGSHAADLIHEAAVAMQMGATAATLAGTIHAHPTMPEGLMEAAEDVEGMAIHLARRKVGAS
ncbi:MAG: dihydrolipoyl dehydrogenase [Nitrospiraceae bacterium]|nr:MAG: dihydrolipoyl dehydrogenase [Nitrospiraceae bacterium]